MAKYRVMCHPQADGTEFYSIETSRWGFIWTPLGSNDEADQFTLATYPTKWEAMQQAVVLQLRPLPRAPEVVPRELQQEA